MKSNKKLGLILIPIILIIVFGAVYFVAKPKPTAGSKNVTITVVDNNGASTSYTVATDAEYLRQAMEEADGLTFSGEESEYGMMVIEVNGVTADNNVDGAYWAFYINDNYCDYGIDSQPVADKDSFKIEYTPAF